MAVRVSSHSKLSWFLEVLTNIGIEINVLFKIAAFCAHNWSTSIKIVTNVGDECLATNVSIVEYIDANSHEIVKNKTFIFLIVE